MKIPKRIDYRAMNAHYCNAAQDCGRSTLQLACGDSVWYSSLASMCLDDEDLVGNHLTSEGQMSSPQDPMMSNPLSLYASFLAFQEQHQESGCDKLIISALRKRYQRQAGRRVGETYSTSLLIGASLYDQGGVGQRARTSAIAAEASDD